jgi:NADPH:quinone reductase-like Zn-dependent oxidoreductase
VKAIAVGNFNEEPRLMDLPDPQPGPGEILVSIDTASINPIDWKAAQGAFRQLMDTRFPLVLGFDGAGRVEALGPGAGRFSVGDLVHGQFWGHVLGPGTFAEHVAIAERPSHGALAIVPDHLDLRLAAAVPTAGMAAEGALAKTAAQSGQTLLILGATGGVGVLATQLAAHAGIMVIATARGQEGGWMKGFGAHETIDYTVRPVASVLADTHPDGIDAVLDLVGDPDQVTRVAPFVRDGGTVVSTAFGVTDQLAGQNRISAINFQLDDRQARLQRVTNALATGQLVIPIQDEVALADGAAAIARQRHGGARGKTLIRV